MKQTLNLLSKDQSDRIENILTSDSFPWYFMNFVNSSKDNQNLNTFNFVHLFYYRDDGIRSPHFENIIMPLLGHIKYNNLIRIKANLFTNRGKKIEFGFHTDVPNEKHKVALYSVNTNNGETGFKNKTFKSIRNSLLLFDGSLEHQSISQTDTKYRININIDYN